MIYAGLALREGRLTQEIVANFQAAPYYRHLGLVASSDAPGTARVRLPFKPELTQLYGGIHGGALLSLADSAMSIAVATTFEAGEKTATVDLSLQFLAPAPLAEIAADAIVIRRGRSLAFAECSLRAGDQEIARGRGIFKISR
jgi:acyl-CoA thioesterase